MVSGVSLRSANVLKRDVDAREIEEGRVERPTHPTQKVIVFLVLGIGQHHEQLRVTAGSAAVLGRACVLPAEAYGVFQAKRSPHELFDDDLLLVGEPPMLADDAQHRHLLLVDLVLGVFVEVHPIAVTADRETVQVRVRPPHRRLEDVVQLRQTHGRGHEKATPHGWLDVDKRDAQPEDALAGRNRHPGTIRRHAVGGWGDAAP